MIAPTRNELVERHVHLAENVAKKLWRSMPASMASLHHRTVLSILQGAPDRFRQLTSDPWGIWCLMR